MDAGAGAEKRRPGSPGPGLAPGQPGHPDGGRLVVVAGERFRVRLRPRHGPLYEYDYAWLSGPNPGYGFGLSGPLEQSEDQHQAHVRDFLSEIDPETGYLREE